MVSWCHGFLIPWYHGVVVSWCHEVFGYLLFVFGSVKKNVWKLSSPVNALVDLFSCVLLSLSYACLATLRVDFFKVLSIQYLDVRNGYFRSLTYSVCVAEVTQVNSISVSPIHAPDFGS